MSRRYKCAIFDLDNTPFKSLEYNKHRCTMLQLQLQKLKAECGLFLGVASFNVQAKEVITQFFAGVFDVVISGIPDKRHDKTSLLQRIRKVYSATHPSQKLKWDEIIYYDDMEEILDHLRQTVPKVTLCYVNGKQGLSLKTLDMLMQRMIIFDLG